VLVFNIRTCLYLESYGFLCEDFFTGKYDITTILG